MKNNTIKWMILFVIGVLTSVMQTLVFCADIIVNSYTKSNLPVPGTPGRIARVTDDVQGLWIDTGSAWQLIGPTAFTDGSIAFSSSNGSLQQNNDFRWVNAAKRLVLNAQATTTINISSSSAGNPSTITTIQNHGLVDGEMINITGHTGSTPDINGFWSVLVVTPTTFTIPVNVTVGGTGGQFIKEEMTGLRFDVVGTPRWFIGKGDAGGFGIDYIGNISYLELNPSDHTVLRTPSGRSIDFQTGDLVRHFLFRSDSVSGRPMDHIEFGPNGDASFGRKGPDRIGPGVDDRMDFESSNSTNLIIHSNVTGDAGRRFSLRSNGEMRWGDGTDAGDVVLQRVTSTVLGLENGTALQFTESSGAPPQPANSARVFARDNGAGKTQLVVQFSSGAVQVLATEP